jgi:predicted secreted Zn-dependent protease
LFLRSDSWVRANKQTQRLLNHERGHFKIGKICAKEIQETINSMTFDRYDYAKQINVVYWKIIEKYREFEKQYDSETDHYKNQAQQELWDKKLNDLLAL